MTQNTTANNERIAARNEFLAALYPDAPDKLWLELRCIHPETGEVRTFWTEPGNDKQREAIFKQADKLNAEGYGVYFAPCLRKEKKGSATSAALVPALWVDVDCDGNQTRRDEGLAKLQEFEPAPSVIVDSGGGWCSVSEPVGHGDRLE
jgi:hypothetical protein